MKVLVEQGIQIPEVVTTGAHKLISSYPNLSKNTVVSVARHSHPTHYRCADIFINSCVNKNLFRPSQEVIEKLMLNASLHLDETNCRVSAALLTDTGKIYTSGEQVSAGDHVQVDLCGLMKEINLSAENSEALNDLLDYSTSTHAEVAVILDAILAGEAPKYLAVSRLPCISCCRLIEAVGIEYITYIHHRDFQAPSKVLLALTGRILVNKTIEVYQGYGRLLSGDKCRS